MRLICMSALYTNTYFNVDGVKHDEPAGFNISSAYTTTKWVFLISALWDALKKTSAVHREDANTFSHLARPARSVLEP